MVTDNSNKDSKIPLEIFEAIFLSTQLSGRMWPLCNMYCQSNAMAVCSSTFEGLQCDVRLRMYARLICMMGGSVRRLSDRVFKYLNYRCGSPVMNRDLLALLCLVS
ncbi:hypothetical protein BJ165DRAFT_625679 [Panaeolus papilionaceus]|nr:hypothetical protein BJ165DRAFT_625679 [Panaeolus papilionaceus]